MIYYVIGNAKAEPWVLNLDGYKTTALADRAINWQRVGQGQFDPPDYWQTVLIDPALGRCHSLDGHCTFTLHQAPYTAEAWANFCERSGYKGNAS